MELNDSIHQWLETNQFSLNHSSLKNLSLKLKEEKETYNRK